MSQHAFHRFAQIPLRVVNGHDDRDSGALLRGAAAPFLKARRQAQIFQRPKIILVRKRRDEILADVVCVEAPDKLFDAFVKGVNVFSPFQPTEIFFKKASLLFKKQVQMKKSRTIAFPFEGEGGAEGDG